MLKRVARIDVDRFAAQVAGVAVLDARADAFGHGLDLLAPVARAAGVREAVVSDERDAVRARAAGFDAVRIDRLGTGADSSAYGLGGSGSPVLALVGEVITVKAVPQGTGVSYGYSYRTARPTRLALVALGYADGVPRLASNRAEVAVHGARHPLVGRIAMDQLVLDVGDADVGPRDEAVLFGDPSRGEPAATEWAAWTARTPLALTAGIAARVARSRS